MGRDRAVSATKGQADKAEAATIGQRYHHRRGPSAIGRHKIGIRHNNQSNGSNRTTAMKAIIKYLSRGMNCLDHGGTT